MRKALGDFYDYLNDKNIVRVNDPINKEEVVNDYMNHLKNKYITASKKSSKNE